MGPFGIVDDEIGVENHLHFLNSFEPGFAALDAEVLIQQGAMESLDDAVRLRALHAGGAVGDIFELEEQFVRMPVRASAELAAIVGQYGFNLSVRRFEGWDDVIVHEVDGGDRQLARMQAGPGIPRVAIDRSLQVDFANALEHADEESIDGNETSGVRGLDVALAEFGREAL